jgi:hypothetical protein
MRTRAFLSPEQRSQVFQIIKKMFAEGKLDREIGEAVAAQGFPGIWSPTRISTMRQFLKLRKDGAPVPEHNPAEQEPEESEAEQESAPLPKVQTLEYTLADLIRMMKDTVKFAEKVQEEFQKKGGGIFF